MSDNNNADYHQQQEEQQPPQQQQYEEQPPQQQQHAQPAPQEIHKVYVRGATIGEGVSQNDLRAAFSKFGEVLDVYAHQGRNFAFVQFSRKEDAETAVAQLGDTEINGCRLTVEIARSTGQQGRRDRGGGDDHGGGGGARSDMKPGDWLCPSCNVNNFARRDRCFRCQADKPGGRRYDDRRGGGGRGRSRERDDRRGGGGYGGGGGYDQRRDYDRSGGYDRSGSSGYDRGFAGGSGGGGGGYDDRAPPARRRSKSRN